MGIVPSIDNVNRPVWMSGAAGSLTIGYCRDCERWTHAPEPRCESCDELLDPRPVSGEGTVFTFTVNHQQYHPDVPPPYVIALVELAEQRGLRMAANIVDCNPDDVFVGMAVRVGFEQRGETLVPVFSPRA